MSKDLPPSRTAEQFVVRFPEGMRDRIKEAAEANNRSMNAEIVARLDASFASQGAQSGLPPAFLKELERMLDEKLTLRGLVVSGDGERLADITIIKNSEKKKKS